jgi:transcriptional regulator with XRE-family HTH domain
MRVDAIHTTYAGVAAELVRALRGRRSQVAFSKRLGYRSSIVQRWEAGQSLPPAATFLQRCARIGVDMGSCFERFYGRRPDWLAQHAADSPLALAAFLRDLRGKVPIRELAARTGKNRYTVSRWLAGSAHPRLHELLALIDVGSQRLLDFIACLIDPARLPSLAPAWAQLQRAREAAYDTPWSHAVLRALELDAARRAPGGGGAWLSRTLGIDAHTLRQALDALQQTGQIEARRGRYRPTGSGDVDTGSDPRRARELKAHWTQTALDRLRAGSPGLFGYAVFAIGRDDLRRLRQVQLEYVQQINAIVAGSKRGECVGLFCTQLIDLAAASLDNALGS